MRVCPPIPLSRALLPRLPPVPGSPLLILAAVRLIPVEGPLGCGHAVEVQVDDGRGDRGTLGRGPRNLNARFGFGHLTHDQERPLGCVPGRPALWPPQQRDHGGDGQGAAYGGDGEDLPGVGGGPFGREQADQDAAADDDGLAPAVTAAWAAPP